MNTEYINILNSYEENSKQEENDIHFRKAIENEEFSCFQQSGSERILNYLKQELGNDIPMLIDFSALPSSFGKNGKMADFMTIYDPFPKAFIDELDKAYHTVYNYLGIKGENLGMFYKKDFFYEPHTASYYFSEESKEVSEVEKNINSGDEKKWLEKDNIYFKNYSFELSYKQFERNLELKKGNKIRCQERNDILLGLYDKYFTNSKKGLLLSVPLIGFPSKSGNQQQQYYEGLGAIFVYFIPDRKPAPDKIRKVANGLWFLGLQITYNSMFQIAYELAENTLKESIKSAIAAIMSRNMSHNLGSHFISNTKNYFSGLIASDPNNKKNYRGIKHSLQYIQERMDFIATITSTDTYPFGAVNAKAQIFDELTPDDFGKRHGQASYNFLMDYLVLSEKISKQSQGKNLSLSKLNLQIGHWDGRGNPVFWDPAASSDEDNKKRDEILGINFAIPGGILGRHAVFSIIENIIRNAAKHGQDKIHEKGFIVKMLYRTDEKRLIVFDNKSDVDIKGTVEKMKGKLKEMRFLTPEGALEQESKGLKEMLICAIWLQNEDVSQVMTANDSQNEEDRLKNFSEYLKVVAVNENGVEIEKNDTTGFLGYSIKLDQYERVHYLKEEELTSECLRDIKSDVVCYKEDREIGEKKLSEIFPRFLVLPSENDVESIGEVEVMRRVVENNCGNEAIQKKMVVDYTTDYNNDSNVVSYKKWTQDHDAFLFKGHAGKSKWEMFDTLFLTKGFEDKYVDAISGGDFTYTLVQPSFVNDEYNLLKIKESVATRFVIIDERIFEHYKSMTQMTCEKGECILEKSKEKSRDKVGEYVFKKKQVLGNGVYSTHEKELYEFVQNTTALSVFLEKDIEQHYLERKGIYVFNLESKKEGFKMVDLSSNGKEFMWNTDKMKFDCNDKRFDTKPTTFLSVHLGLIDKIKELLLKSGENKVTGDAIDKEIVEALKLYFGASFVSVHSGRGGFDIRESLRQYAFQSFSAIENPLYNSKFLLAQQFYNLKYYGSKQ